MSIVRLTDDFRYHHKQLLGSNCHNSYFCVNDPNAVGGVNNRLDNCLRENSMYFSKLVRVSFVLEIK